jgi:hypothetical protein
MKKIKLIDYCIFWLEYSIMMLLVFSPFIIIEYARGNLRLF